MASLREVSPASQQWQLRHWENKNGGGMFTPQLNLQARRNFWSRRVAHAQRLLKQHVHWEVEFVEVIRRQKHALGE